MHFILKICIYCNLETTSCFTLITNSVDAVTMICGYLYPIPSMCWSRWHIDERILMTMMQWWSQGAESFCLRVVSFMFLFRNKRKFWSDTTTEQNNCRITTLFKNFIIIITIFINWGPSWLSFTAVLSHGLYEQLAAGGGVSALSRDRSSDYKRRIITGWKWSRSANEQGNKPRA